MRTFSVTALLLAASASGLWADTLSTMPGLQNVYVREISGGVSTDRALTLFSMIRWPNLTSALRDFTTSSGELYDVYFSDAVGTANYAGGEYISITALFSGPGSGLNIDRVWLRFNNGRPDLVANVVTSFNPGISDYVVGSELYAVDGVNGTYTEMGQSASGNRMRITVGFPAVAAVPEPASWLTAAFGLALCGFAELKRRCRTRD